MMSLCHLFRAHIHKAPKEKNFSYTVIETCDTELQQNQNTIIKNIRQYRFNSVYRVCLCKLFTNNRKQKQTPGEIKEISMKCFFGLGIFTVFHRVLISEVSTPVCIKASMLVTRSAMVTACLTTPAHTHRLVTWMKSTFSSWTCLLIISDTEQFYIDLMYYNSRLLFLLWCSLLISNK